MGHRDLREEKKRKEAVRNFYSSILFEPSLPTESNFRHYRFKNLSGHWVKVTRRIRNFDDLVKQIRKLDGGDIYYSTSTWLNPDELASANDPDVLKVVLLSNDLTFDVDCDEPYCIENLELARKSTSNIYEAMKSFKERFLFKYAAFTGRSGFRLVYEDLQPVSCDDPKTRIALVKEDRKIFIGEMLKKIEELKLSKKAFNIRTRLDEDITWNPLCVVRVLGTVHTKTGFITQKIRVGLLKRHITELLNSLICIYAERPRIPSIREMTIDIDKYALSPRPRPLLPRRNDTLGLVSPSYYFVSNKVPGTKCFVPLLIYQDTKKNVEREIKRIQEEYALGNIYVLRKDNSLIFLSLKLFQRNQLQKLLNKTSSQSKVAYKKYSENYFYASAEYIKMIPGELKGQISKSHANYLNTMYDLNIETKIYDSSSKQIKISKGVKSG